MKRTMTLLIVATMVASPALAYAPQAEQSTADDANPVAAERLVDAEALAEAVVTAARELVLEEMSAKRIAPQGEGGKLGSGSRTAIGIGMLVAGAALIWKASDNYQSEPDRFGRIKNADAYLGYGVGGTIMFFGALVFKGGIAGEGFQ